MRVFLTGGTGFVGREILRQLTQAGYRVRALVRHGSENKLTARNNVEVHFGDAVAADTLQDALAGCDAVINLVGIIREFPGQGITFQRLHVEATRNLIDAAEAQGARRFVQMSANGVRPKAKAAYHQSKWAAEELVRASALDWTILRPSIIFGPEGEFVTMLADLIRKLPIIPVIGNGLYRMQPVAIEEVAASFVKTLELPDTIEQTYQVGGRESYTYEEILDLTGKAIGKDVVRKLHHPLFMMKPVIKLLEGAAAFPITSDQLTMMLESNVCDPEPWAKAYGIAPVSYAEGIGRCFRKARK
jgi:NADH dehydrogenase